VNRAAYREDLAYIHDAGFGDFAAGAAPWLMKLFAKHSLDKGLVVDLGCGSGIWAGQLAAAGYRVLGFDISAAMIAIARKRVPRAVFRRESFLAAELPPCVAVTAMGEVFNYLFDDRNTQRRLGNLFRRIHDALCRGGLLVFDGAEPGRVPGGGPVQKHRQGPDWTCLSTTSEDRRRKTLTREITSFRKVGGRYRRDREVHRLRLFDRAQVARQLRDIGFRVRTIRGYGPLRFPPGYVGFVARKP
jgi:SAM-dependent methyltransferase